MSDWIDLLREHAFKAGYAGLLALSVIDSVGVPTAGGPDVVLILLASLRPQALHAVGLVLTATLGSLVGCVILYGFARRGGHPRFSAAADLERVRRALEKRGIWVVFLAVLAPPPIPTKLFVFCAGLVGVPLAPFVGATVVGRLIRYGLGAALGLSYGPHALDIMREHSAAAAGVLVALCALLILVAVLRRRRWARGD